MVLRAANRTPLSGRRRTLFELYLLADPRRSRRLVTRLGPFGHELLSTLGASANHTHSRNNILVSSAGSPAG